MQEHSDALNFRDDAKTLRQCMSTMYNRTHCITARTFQHPPSRCLALRRICICDSKTTVPLTVVWNTLFDVASTTALVPFSTHNSRGDTCMATLFRTSWVLRIDQPALDRRR